MDFFNTGGWQQPAQQSQQQQQQQQRQQNPPAQAKSSFSVIGNRGERGVKKPFG